MRGITYSIFYLTMYITYEYHINHAMLALQSHLAEAGNQTNHLPEMSISLLEQTQKREYSEISSLLQGAKPMSRPSPPSLHTSENEVERQIIGFLQNQTPPWIIDRQHVGMFYTIIGTPIKMGRTGQCDWRAMRAGQYFEFEVKAPGETPKPAQYEYMALRTHQGILVTWADSLEMFERWYKAMPW